MQLTPIEFQDMLDGYVWRKQQERNDLIEQAWLTAYFQRVKKMPRLDKLINKKASRPKGIEQARRDYEELKRLYG